MSWWEYVERVANTTRQRDIAERTGIDPTNVTRWKAGQVPKPAFVATFARAYGRPVLEAFIAAEFLTPEEAKARPAKQPDLTQLTNRQLLELVASRMRDEGSGSGGASITKGPWGDGGGEPGGVGPGGRGPLSDGPSSVPDSKVALDDPDLLPEREAQIEDP